MQFKDIVGQDQVKRHLIQTVLENRVSHAQLFLGPAGSGSLPLAIAYAQYINCENRTAEDSCGQCPSCHKYSKFIHPDLHFSFPFLASTEHKTAASFMDIWRKTLLKHPYLTLEEWKNELEAGNKQVNINREEAHSIIKKLSLKAFEAEYKVLIMWLPEFLDTQGNALLKLIEEPPEKTLFLLVAENQDRILSTLISRTQLVKINKLTPEDITGYLISHDHLSEKAASEIAFIADGNLQEAINQVSSNHRSHFELLVQWLRFIVTDNGIEFIRMVEDDLSKAGRENQKSFLLYALNIFREILIMQEGLKDYVRLPENEKNFVEKFAEHYAFEQIMESVNLLEKAYFGIERNANPKILFLDLSLQLVLILKYKTFPKGTQYI